VSQVIEAGGELPVTDLHCPLMSLPLAFGTTLATIPAPVRYLRGEPGRKAAWEATLGGRSGLRVGLAWRGGAGHVNDRNRSIPLGILLRSLPVGIDFISLQQEVRADDRAALQASPIRHVGDELHDFNDTAALCETVDLVVTVDTSVAHLAGALGKRVWILLPWLPDWRWLLEREDSPWYRSATLFRQKRRGDWECALDKLGRDMAILARDSQSR
jgi:hypothetical protein